jgi:hypothetical protein
MTREELREHCKRQVEGCEMWAKSKGEEPSGKVYEEHKLILELLEQQPILDKIRAEIIEEKEWAYADFERYKVEYLGQDWEDAYDSLPQDDFRYGMERCVEIIDKYRESE